MTKTARGEYKGEKTQTHKNGPHFAPNDDG